MPAGKNLVVVTCFVIGSFLWMDGLAQIDKIFRQRLHVCRTTGESRLDTYEAAEELAQLFVEIVQESVPLLVERSEILLVILKEGG